MRLHIASSREGRASAKLTAKILWRVLLRTVPIFAKRESAGPCVMHLSRLSRSGSTSEAHHFSKRRRRFFEHSLTSLTSHIIGDYSPCPLPLTLVRSEQGIGSGRKKAHSQTPHCRSCRNHLNIRAACISVQRESWPCAASFDPRCCSKQGYRRPIEIKPLEEPGIPCPRYLPPSRQPPLAAAVVEDCGHGIFIWSHQTLSLCPRKAERCV